MKSNYKQLGPYIRVVDKRNKELEVDLLLGVSIQKIFIPSIANTIGADMSKYKIIYNKQFAYGPVTSRNGDKISVALLEKEDAAIVSQAYVVFEIIDHEVLDPEYLMMWFRRPEFDRYARFKSHGSARETFDWDEMCEIELPTPSITKQREIVKEYNTIVNRISLNEKLNQKLEETAQTLYKHWFVDFEFPNEDGKPYKSSGGEMAYNEELEKDIPVGWLPVTIRDFADDMKNGATPNRSTNEYWESNDIPWLKTGEVCNNIVIEAEEYISKKGFEKSSTKLIPIDSVLIAMYGATAAQISYLKFETTTNQACCAITCSNTNLSTYLYYFLLNKQAEIADMAIGGAQPNLSKNLIEELILIQPKKNILESHPFIKIIDYREKLTREILSLVHARNILLSRMTKIKSIEMVS